MIQETDSKQLKLPDRKEITLCEAVTAFVYGKASNVVQQMLDGEAETETHSARAKDLIERLHSAAYAGHIKFRALKNGDDHADGHKDIDRLYFSEPRGLRWYRDEIWSGDHPKFKSRPPSFTRDWRDVHLDREDFEALLRGMGVSVQQNPDTNPRGNSKTSRTGVAGRPTSIHLVLDIARRRLDAGDHPDTLAKFSEQLVDALAKAEPQAHPMTPKTVRNSPALRELWRKRSKIKDPPEFWAPGAAQNYRPS
jgi:hypothetical protein